MIFVRYSRKFNTVWRNERSEWAQRTSTLYVSCSQRQQKIYHACCARMWNTRVQLCHRYVPMSEQNQHDWEFYYRSRITSFNILKMRLPQQASSYRGDRSRFSQALGTHFRPPTWQCHRTRQIAASWCTCMLTSHAEKSQLATQRKISSTSFSPAITHNRLVRSVSCEHIVVLWVTLWYLFARSFPWQETTHKRIFSESYLVDCGPSILGANNDKRFNLWYWKKHPISTRPISM